MVAVGQTDLDFDGDIDGADFLALQRGGGITDDWQVNFSKSARIPAVFADLVVADLFGENLSSRGAVEDRFNSVGGEVVEHLGEAGLALVQIPAGSLALSSVANWRIVIDAVDEIVGGTLTNEYESVGKVVGSGSCTGTLIGGNYVLTAAHCLEGLAGDQARFILDDGREFISDAIFIHPNYQSNGPFIGPNDIAIMRLADSVTGITPSDISRTALIIGTPVTMVGYGRGGVIGGPVDSTFGIKREGFNDVDALDQVFDKTVTYITEVGEATTASGDSGGPTFIEQGSKLVVASVNSGGSVAKVIGGRSVQTDVSEFANWIDGIVGEPVPPNPTPPALVGFSVVGSEMQIQTSWDRLENPDAKVRIALRRVGSSDFDNVAVVTSGINLTTVTVTSPGEYEVKARSQIGSGAEREFGKFTSTFLATVTAPKLKPPTFPGWISNSGGVLSIRGTSANDQLTLVRSGSDVIATFNGQTAVIQRSLIVSWSIKLGSGDDLFENRGLVGLAEVWGGAGSDTFRLGAGRQYAHGGDNRDFFFSLDSNLTNDRVWGGNGKRDEFHGLGVSEIISR